MTRIYDRVFVAGHRGLVGSALHRALARHGYPSAIVAPRSELDLTDGSAVREFFRVRRPQAVLLAAAKVGGIGANSRYPWDFLYENLAIETAVLSAAVEFRVERVVFFGSSCVYPRLAPQPMTEEHLLTGALEPTNEPYAVAKISGIKLVEAANKQFGTRWISLMPTNLYGPNDNFDAENSHVLPAMIRKFHAAAEARDDGADSKPVRLWGTGSALREFLHVDDLADAAVHVLPMDITGLYNVGSGEEVTIRELAGIVAEVVGYDGPVEWDRSKPDGTPRKLIDSTRIRATGWTPRIDLRTGIAQVYDWFRGSVLANASA